MEEILSGTEEKKESTVSHKPRVISQRKAGRPKAVPTREQVLESVRPDRSKPVRVKYADRNLLTFEGLDPNFRYYGATDKPGNIEKMKRAGYELVESDKPLGDFRVADGSKMGKAVSKPSGGGFTTYLMRIPREFYDEDRKAKDDHVNRIEKSLQPNKAKDEYGPGLTSD